MCNKEERYRGRDREREREREVKLEQTKLKRRAVGSVRIRTCINSKGEESTGNIKKSTGFGAVLCISLRVLSLKKICHQRPISLSLSLSHFDCTKKLK